eukprot:242224-Pyramimonas_sp.AAC.1
MASQVVVGCKWLGFAVCGRKLAWGGGGTMSYRMFPCIMSSKRVQLEKVGGLQECSSAGM